eukprot:GHVU01054832.1.p1 GENE.GHVU01054832.1~~GHVU01054832.1.p1  ORF type:complete len:109 (+),score=4.23 GHVU01054832.1:506-832(+)
MTAACHLHILRRQEVARDSFEELQQDVIEFHRLRGLRARNRGYLYQLIRLGGARGCFWTCTRRAITFNFLTDLESRTYPTPPASSLGDLEEAHSTTCSGTDAEPSPGE